VNKSGKIINKPLPASKMMGPNADF